MIVSLEGNNNPCLKIDNVLQNTSLITCTTAVMLSHYVLYFVKMNKNLPISSTVFCFVFKRQTRFAAPRGKRDPLIDVVCLSYFIFVLYFVFVCFICF